MKKLSKLASAMPFAHYLGLGAHGARAEEGGGDDDERKQREDESDEEHAKRMEELDEKEKKDKESKAKSKSKADEEDGDVDAAADDESDDNETESRSGRAQGARQRERMRCAAIVAAGVKAGAVNQACVFAFDTSMTASQAVAALGASQLDRPRSQGLAQRMAANPVPNAGIEASTATSNPTSAEAAAQAIIAAGKKRRGEA